MKITMKTWLERYRHMDWAVLYLRLFSGGIILLHNVGKMQTYNEIVDSYPEVLHMNGAVLFTVISIAEVLLAVLLMMGLWVRLSAMFMAIGMLLSIFVVFPHNGFMATELQFVYAGIYIFFVISGAGLYSFDSALAAKRRKRRN